MNYDKILINVLWDKDKNQGSAKYRRLNQKQNYYVNIVSYLEDRFNDSINMYESLIRLVFNINERPKCPICGNELIFIGKPNSKGIYQKTCSKSCNAKLNINKQLNKNIKQNIIKGKKTKLEKYGDENYNNREKSKNTCLEKYNANSPLGNIEVIEKCKQTKLERYGDPNYHNHEGEMLTKIVNYGFPIYVNSYKAKETCLRKYGVPNVFQTEKNKKALKDKYSDRSNAIQKVKDTKLIKYGDENYNNYEKTKQTCLEKYGSITYVSSNDHKIYMKVNRDKITCKINETKRKNKTFNVSKTEDKTYELLKEKYPDVKRQYKDDRYPFNCDFYVPSLDLFIECNYHWTHYIKPYEGTKEDILILEKWKDKNTKFYDCAIKTWTERDTIKRHIAKVNELNWIEFFDIKAFIKWFQTINLY